MKANDDGGTPPPSAQGAPLSELTRAMSTPGIASLLRRAAQEGINTFRDADVTALRAANSDELRRFLNAVLEPLSVLVTSLHGLHFWYFPTSQIRRYCYTLDAEASADSPLARRLAAQPTAVVNLNVLNAITSTRLDGIEIDFAAARDLLLLNRRPRNVPERIAANSFALFGDLAMYAERAIGVDVIVEVFERLTFDTPVPDGWLDAPASHDLHLHAATFATPREVLEGACAILREGFSRADIHPSIPPMNMLANIYSAQPFPMLNGTMARLLMHIGAIRSGYPVLGLAPYSAAVEDWAAGRIGSAEGLPPESSLRATVHEPNITAWITAWLALGVRAVERLHNHVQSAEAAHDSHQDLLALDPSLNSRQCLLLGRAIDEPTTTLRIAEHKTTHDIAYSTARQDFLELEEKGYLVRGREGNAFTFRIAPAFTRQARESTTLLAKAST